MRGPKTQHLAPVPGPDRYNQHQPFEVLPEHSRRVLEFFEVSGWSTVPLSSPIFLLPLSFSLCPLSPPCLAELMERIRKEVKRERGTLPQKWKMESRRDYCLFWKMLSCSLEVTLKKRCIHSIFSKTGATKARMTCVYVFGTTYIGRVPLFLCVQCKQMSYRLINLGWLRNEVGRDLGTTEATVNLPLYLHAQSPWEPLRSGCLDT